jgi:hypothetical protein
MVSEQFDRMETSLNQQLTNKMFNKVIEKDSIDKFFGLRDSERIKDLMQKEDLSRSEVLELMYLMTATESKLYNFDEYERIVVLKYYVWVRWYSEIYEHFTDSLRSIENTKLATAKSRQLVRIIDKKYQHGAKFFVDLFFAICRTSLSLEAVGFKVPQETSGHFKLTHEDKATPQVKQ